MGVKGTVTLTREQAEERFRILQRAAWAQHIEKWIAAELAVISDKRLEDELETMNDERCGGEGFENYVITRWRHAD